MKIYTRSALIILIAAASIVSVSCSFCPKGMFWSKCGHHECRFSCNHPRGPKGCIPKSGPPGCTCLLDLVMRETDRTCVKKEECPNSLTTVSPPKVTTPPKVATTPTPLVKYGKCPEGMFVDVCGHHKCRFSGTHPQGPKGCTPKCGPPGCTCLLHLVMRETDGKCVKKEECTKHNPTTHNPTTHNPTTHPPQTPKPGTPYPDKPGSTKKPSNNKQSLASYGLERPPKRPSYPQRVAPHTGKCSRKYKYSRKHSSGGSPQRIGRRKCPRGRFS